MSGLSARALAVQARAWLGAGRAAVVVSVDRIKGSTPRNEGTRMLVSLTEVHGTIGGGHLEWQAIDMAHQALRGWAGQTPQPPARWQHTFPLGPTLGQCCGGVVVLGFEPLTQAALAQWPQPQPRFHLELHGAGHVGQAIVHLLRDIDCTVRWIDERTPESAPGAWAGLAVPPGVPTPQQQALLPPHIDCLATEAAEAEVPQAPPWAAHLVLTHRHDLDLHIVKAVLARPDTAFVGMIGSQTKAAKFRHRLADAGLPAGTVARLHCPIGVPDIAGKEPPVIAIAVVAQLLQRFPPGGLTQTDLGEPGDPSNQPR